MAKSGLHGQVDMASFCLTLSDGAKQTRWFPRFVGVLGDGRYAYSEQLTEFTTGFVGWLPYRRGSWNTARDKRAFKAYAASRGIATPAASTDPASQTLPFIVKSPSSSFGSGIRGPCVRHDPECAQQRLQAGEYCETFVAGYIVKAFYWGATLVAVEFFKMPAVKGDGRATLRQLVERVPARQDGRGHDWEALGGLAQLSGVGSLDEVPAKDQEVLIDFKYGSRYERSLSKNRNTIDRLRAIPALAEQFAQAGRVFAESIGSSENREATFYTLDAIVDADEKAWFLEMNSSPMVHPDAYSTMLQTLYR